MKLNIRKTKNYNYYSIIEDYTTIEGKRTSRTFRKLCNQKQIGERFGKVDIIK